MKLENVFKKDPNGNVSEVIVQTLHGFLEDQSGILETHQKFIEDNKKYFGYAEKAFKSIRFISIVVVGFLSIFGVSVGAIIAYFTFFLWDLTNNNEKMLRDYSTTLLAKIEKKTSEIDLKLNSHVTSSEVLIKTNESKIDKHDSNLKLLGQKIDTLDQKNINLFTRSGILDGKITVQENLTADFQNKILMRQEENKKLLEKTNIELKSLFEGNNNLGIAVFPVHFKKTNDSDLPTRGRAIIKYQSVNQPSGLNKDSAKDDTFLVQSFYFNSGNTTRYLHYLQENGDNDIAVKFKRILAATLSIGQTKYLAEKIKVSITPLTNEGQGIELKILDPLVEFEKGVMGNIVIIYEK